MPPFAGMLLHKDYKSQEAVISKRCLFGSSLTGDEIGFAAYCTQTPAIWRKYRPGEYELYGEFKTNRTYMEIFM